MPGSKIGLKEDSASLKEQLQKSQETNRLLNQTVASLQQTVFHLQGALTAKEAELEALREEQQRSVREVELEAALHQIQTLVQTTFEMLHPPSKESTQSHKRSKSWTEGISGEKAQFSVNQTK